MLSKSPNSRLTAHDRSNGRIAALSIGEVRLQQVRVVLATAEAISSFDEALAIDREVENKDNAAGDLSNIGAALFQMGDLKGARERYMDALAIFRATANPDGEANALANGAEVSQELGDLPRARRAYEEAVGMFRKIGDKSSTARFIGDLHCPGPYGACRQEESLG